MGEKTQLGEGRIFFNGCEAKAIPDFECTESEYIDAGYKATEIISGTALSLNLKFDRFLFYKLCGIWDWVLMYCPDRRVVHLAKYGRTERVRRKNFNRAIKILGKEIDS